MNMPFPGMSGPAAGFDAPFEMLAGCHERVRRTLDLLARLLAHLPQHGADAQARSAAQDVLRYFDLAAPQHHLDEELHLVPVLQASADPALQAAAAQLLAEHALIRPAWALLRELLAELQQHGRVPDGLDAAARHFIALHEPHLELEDGLVYPAAQQRIATAQQQLMGDEMAARRGVPPPR